MSPRPEDNDNWDFYKQGFLGALSHFFPYATKCSLNSSPGFGWRAGQDGERCGPGCHPGVGEWRGGARRCHVTLAESQLITEGWRSLWGTGRAGSMGVAYSLLLGSILKDGSLHERVSGPWCRNGQWGHQLGPQILPTWPPRPWELASSAVGELGRRGDGEPGLGTGAPGVLGSVPPS